MNKPTIQNFCRVQVVRQGFRWRGKWWHQAEISLYKTAGGYQKTEEEYRALIDVWYGRGNGRNQEVFIDECLFTFDEVVALREYLPTVWPEGSGHAIFRAMLFLDYPIKSRLVGPFSPSESLKWNSLRQIHFYNLPDYPLELKLMGFCKFRGPTKEEEEEAEEIAADLAVDDWRYTKEELEKWRAESAADYANWIERHDAKEVALHGPSETSCGLVSRGS